MIDCRKLTDMCHTWYELQILGSSPPSESSSCFSDYQRVAPPKNPAKTVCTVDFRHRRDFQLDDKALRKAEVGTLQQKNVSDNDFWQFLPAWPADQKQKDDDTKHGDHDVKHTPTLDIWRRKALTTSMRSFGCQAAVDW